ncbi:MAG: hypothetical protein KZQ87_12765 [Candidatus Thiodiazotropha sp. (ex Cardiolucina cf. quadrata)]|nr:hypothetical protein [Candidatus Thiodiazotropha sp. (ex Cardiolucina cf. quadrata)]
MPAKRVFDFVIRFDPMTRNDIKNVAIHPSLEDGNLTVYFETEATHKNYIDLPLNHPNRCLPYPAANSDDCGG